MDKKLKRKKNLVISATNFTEGGPLTILLDSVNSAINFLGPSWRVFALINNRELLNLKNVKIIEIKKPKKSWLYRLFYEYFIFNIISKKIQPDLWLSLHDITPTVKTRRLAVYCHNPSPFYKVKFLDVFLDLRFVLFNFFYIMIYSINIKKNDIIIVQQEWIRSKFRHIFNLNNILVAHPVQYDSNFFGESDSIKRNISHIINRSSEDKVIFLYPSLPRVFKNIQTICDAGILLPKSIQCKIEIRLTINGFENRYSKYLYKKYSTYDFIKFMGIQDRSSMIHQYKESSVVLFPSKLETWGLPISEAKFYNKPILVSDLDYAHETVGHYDKVCFVSPYNPRKWSEAMSNIVSDMWIFSASHYKEPSPPFCDNWDSLWAILVKDL